MLAEVTPAAYKRSREFEGLAREYLSGIVPDLADRPASHVAYVSLGRDISFLLTFLAEQDAPCVLASIDGEPAILVINAEHLEILRSQGAVFDGSQEAVAGDIEATRIRRDTRWTTATTHKVDNSGDGPRLTEIRINTQAGAIAVPIRRARAAEQIMRALDAGPFVA